MNSLPEDIQIVIWKKVNESYMKSIEKEIKIEFVLKQFKAMGCDRLNLIEEHSNFHSSEEYYNYWCGDIRSWCNGY